MPWDSNNGMKHLRCRTGGVNGQTPARTTDLGDRHFSLVARLYPIAIVFDGAMTVGSILPTIPGRSMEKQAPPSRSDWR